MKIEGVITRPNEIVKVQGHKMMLDDVDSLRLRSRGIHEPGVTRLVREKIKPGDVVLDIGAHIGYYTLIFAELVGPEGEVTAIEPNLATLTILRQNVLLNGYDGVIFSHCAAWNETAYLPLWLNSKNKADNRCWDPGRPWKKIMVDAIRIDHWCPMRVDFIKMDIQGAEYRALLGMLKLLEDNPQVKIVSEFSPAMLEACGPGKPEDFPDLLQSLGFKIWHIPDKGPLEPVDTARLMQLTPKSRFRNIYCERPSK